MSARQSTALLPLRQFFSITVPLLSPILQLVLMLSVLGTMKMTDLILVLTNGGPGGTTEVVMTYIFKYFFSYGDNAARDVQFGYCIRDGSRYRGYPRHYDADLPACLPQNAEL